MKYFQDNNSQCANRFMKKIQIQPFRAISLLLLVGSLLAAGYLGYNYYKRVSIPIKPAIKAIHPNTYLLVEVKDQEKFFQKIKNSEFWENFLGFECISKLHEQVYFVDSVFYAIKKEKQFDFPGNFYIAAIQNDSIPGEWVYYFNLEKITDEKYVFNSFEKHLRGDYSKHSYSVGEDDVIVYKKNKRTKIAIAEKQGVFLISGSKELLIDALSNLTHGKVLYNKNVFKRVYHTSGKNADATVFINYPFLQEKASEYVKDKEKFIPGLPVNFSEWSAFDIDLRNNNLIMNGFSSCKDEYTQYLSCFYKQTPKENKAIQILPSNAIGFINYAFSDFETYHTRFKKFLEQEDQLASYNKEIGIINKTHNIEVEQEILSWIGYELCHLEFPGPGVHKNRKLAIIHAIDTTKARKTFQKLQYRSKKKSTTYKGFKIGQLRENRLLSVFFPAVFYKHNNRYYIRYKNFFVFSEDLSTMKNFINHITAKRFLVDNSYYKTFSSNIAGESNLYFYSALHHKAKEIPSKLNKSIEESFKQNIDSVENIYAIAAQFNTEGQLFYNNIVMHYNPHYEARPFALWKTSLDTTVATNVNFVSDHSDNTCEIAAMDVSNKFYLIDKNGEIRWKKQLGSPVLGNFKQIDFYKNGKLQLVFNTSDSVYIIDREGKFVEDYPHAIPHKATASMAVFDYEDNKDYRFLIPTTNKRVLNYDKNWSQVKGWRFNKTQHKVEKSPQHFLLETIDYITLIDNRGKIYILDRKGKSKTRNFKHNFRVSENSKLYAAKTKDKKNVFICSSTSGNVYYIDPTDGNTGKLLSVKDFEEGHSFFYMDFNLDGENDFVFSNKNRVKVISNNREIFKWKSVNQEILYTLCYGTQNLNTRLGVVLEKDNKAYLFGPDGKELKGTPFDGDKIYFTGNEYLGVIVSHNKEIIVYQVNE